MIRRKPNRINLAALRAKSRHSNQSTPSSQSTQSTPSTPSASIATGKESNNAINAPRNTPSQPANQPAKPSRKPLFIQSRKPAIQREKTNQAAPEANKSAAILARQKNSVKIHQPLIPIPETKQHLAHAATKAASQIHLAKVKKALMPLPVRETKVPIDSVKPKPSPVTPAPSASIPTAQTPDGITYDPSQLAAIDLLEREKFSCLIGAAGTGKTTVLKAAIQALSTSVAALDMTNYWKKAKSVSDDDSPPTPAQPRLPAICLCAFTGQATQMIKKNMPKSWHQNIMTIHRMLNYYPEYYADMDENGQMVNKMRFVPAYTRTNVLPWDIIIIDESGMCSVDLWSKIYDALRREVIDRCKPGTRVILVGDINQLPPVHGKPILAHGMIKWPVAELTKIHRQKGTHNPIVENAWRIIHGEKPIKYPTFNMFELPTDPNKAQTLTRQVYKAFREKLDSNGKPLFDPDSDVIITPMNGDKIAYGAPLGQVPLNDMLATIDLKNYKEDHDSRYLINAGREKKAFAVGDRVMATKNDYEAGITNGMMGEIVDIKENPSYSGITQGYGILNLAPDEVAQDYIELNPDFQIDIKEIENQMNELAAKGKSTLEAERGAASHIVTVRFGPKESATDKAERLAIDPDSKDPGLFISFSTFSEICTLQLCYAITCHKAQGAEFDTVIIILHSSHSRALYREWLYTAITRAKKRVILLYTKKALTSTLKSQRIQGSTLKEKIKSFSLLANINPQQIPDLPKPGLVGVWPETQPKEQSINDLLEKESANAY